MSRACSLRRVVSALAILCALAPGAAAQTPVPDYTLSVWASERGLPPGDVFAMTQDTAGYLWLGTPTGLQRFDGTTFVPWSSVNDRDPQPNGPVHSLITARDGSLWAGFGGGGGVVRIDHGRLVRFAQGPDTPGGAVALLEDRAGTIWAASRRGLFRFRNHAWALTARDEGFPGGEVFSLFEDRLGRLWVGSSAGVYRRTGTMFEPVDRALTSVQSFVEDRVGDLWVTDTYQIVKRVADHAAPKHADVRLPAAGWRVLSDRRGQVWVAAFGGGLLRLASNRSAPPVLDRFEYEQRLAGSPRSLYEDRDGNLWVGMRGGLLRLSERLVDGAVPLDGLTHDGVRTMGLGADGSVWIATGHALNRFVNGRRDVYPVSQALTVHTDRHGEVWVSTTQGLGRMRGGRYQAVRLPDAVDWSRVMAATSDGLGTMWICSTLAGVMSWNGQALRRFEDVPAVAGRGCQTVLADARNRVWVGFQAGGIAVYDNGTFQRFGEPEGLSAGSVLAMIEDRSGAVWIATATGISRFHQGRLVAVTANAPLHDVVPVLAEDEEGYIWLGVNSGVGVIRFHPNEADAIAGNRAHHLEYVLYDETDGMQPSPLTWQSGIGAVRATDGRLWLTSGSGVTIIDPHRLSRSRQPAPPHLDAVTADGHKVSPGRKLTFAAATDTIEIGYGTVSISSASKLRFRYRLDGLDRDWIYAGDRRAATYTRLPPGDYRFRVSATHGGDWIESMPWDFSVAPPIYRTLWFAPTLALGLAVIAAAAWWLRVRALRQRYALVFAERARVSREIHDTLLQSMAALGVELEAIATQLDATQSPVRDTLRRLRREVGHSVRDARESILELRRDTMTTRDVATSLRELAERTARIAGVQVDVAVSGKRPSRWPVDVDLQLLRIGQEAVANAVRHGRASEVGIVIAYEQAGVKLTVRDNGSGFDPDEHPGAAEPGAHLGLVTMRERAARLRGRLHVASRPGAGTMIEASIPVHAE